MKRILLVEDNPDNRDLVDAFVGHLYEIEFVEDGRSALSSLEQSVPDLFLFDISLPEMDGVELLRKVREIPECAGIPAIAMTSHAMKGDKERFIAAGFDGYVSKPVADEEVLIQAIEALIN